MDGFCSPERSEAETLLGLCNSSSVKVSQM